MHTPHANARLCSAEHAEPISEESELHKRCPLQLRRRLRTWLGLGLGLDAHSTYHAAVHSARSLNDKPYELALRCLPEERATLHT